MISFVFSSYLFCFFRIAGPSIDFDTIFVLIGIVNTFEIPDVKVDDYINFSFALVSRFKSCSSTLKKMGNMFGSYMKKNAVYFGESFHVIENLVVDAIVSSFIFVVFI